VAVDSDKAFLGVGWSFPPVEAADGDVATAAYEEDIRQAVHIILGTGQGERVMRPDFGAGLQELVFEPVSTTTTALVRHRVQEALVTWEPRIDLDRVDVTADGVVPSKLLVEIEYRVRATNTFYNLVYPFYLLEAESP
jgi:phage baseplate assembly protein W